LSEHFENPFSLLAFRTPAKRESKLLCRKR